MRTFVRLAAVIVRRLMVVPRFVEVVIPAVEVISALVEVAISGLEVISASAEVVISAAEVVSTLVIRTLREAANVGIWNENTGSSSSAGRDDSMGSLGGAGRASVAGVRADYHLRSDSGSGICRVSSVMPGARSGLPTTIRGRWSTDFTSRHKENTMSVLPRALGRARSGLTFSNNQHPVK